MHAPCLFYSQILNMEVTYTYKTLIITYQTIRRNIPEDTTFQSQYQITHTHCEFVHELTAKFYTEGRDIF